MVCRRSPVVNSGGWKSLWGAHTRLLLVATDGVPRRAQQLWKGNGAIFPVPLHHGSLRSPPGTTPVRMASRFAGTSMWLSLRFRQQHCSSASNSPETSVRQVNHELPSGPVGRSSSWHPSFCEGIPCGHFSRSDGECPISSDGEYFLRSDWEHFLRSGWEYSTRANLEPRLGVLPRVRLGAVHQLFLRSV